MNVRRTLYLIDAISKGHNTMTRLFALTGLDMKAIHRTVKDHVRKLGVQVEIKAMEDGDVMYTLNDWGAINPTWVRDNHLEIAGVLNLPIIKTIVHKE